MKFIGIILLIFSSQLIAYDVYDAEKLKEFGPTRDRESLEKVGLEFGQGFSGFSGPKVFFLENQLALSDMNLFRVVSLDQDYNIKDIYKDLFIYGHSIVYSNDIILGYASASSLTIIKEKAVLGKVRLKGSYMRLVDYMYHSDILFMRNNNGKFWAVKNPTLDNQKNQSNLLQEKDIFQLFEENNGNLNGLTIDTQKRLFLHGELFTVSLKIYCSYWKELNGDIAGEVNGSKIKYDTFMKSYGFMLIGKDSEGNSYWSSSSHYINIFNTSGVLIEQLRINPDIIKSQAAVSPEGDIYFMQHEPEKATLYRIKRQW